MQTKESVSGKRKCFIALNSATLRSKLYKSAKAKRNYKTTKQITKLSRSFVKMI